MKNFYLLLLSAFMLVLSCRAEDDPVVTEEQPLAQLKADVFYPGAVPYDNSALFFKFEYNTKQQLTRKVGGFLPASGSTGGLKYFSDKIYTTFSYNGNQITAENKSSSADFTVQPEKRMYLLDQNNRVVEKEVPHTNFYLVAKQTFMYEGDRLIEIMTTYPNMSYDPNDPNDYIETWVEKFTYDGGNNLIKTENIQLHNGKPAGIRIVRTFGNYDTAKNVCKSLFLVEDLMYRSLSANNYRSYSEEEFWFNELQSSKTQNWTFNYDSNGQLIIN